MRPTSLALVVLSVMLLGGCYGKKVAVHPGAVSNLDSYAYDILLVEQDVIAQARTDYLAGKLPAQAVSFLRIAITQYNTTQAAWHAYHDQHAGNDTALQDAVNALVAAVAQLQQVLGKSPAVVPSSTHDDLRPDHPAVAGRLSCFGYTGPSHYHQIPCGGVA